MEGEGVDETESWWINVVKMNRRGDGTRSYLGTESCILDHQLKEKKQYF